VGRCGVGLGPAGFLGAFPGAFVLDVADGQPQQLDHRVVVGEMAPVLDDLPQLIVQRLAAVGGVDDLADLGRELQERDEPLPRVPPDPDRRRIPLPPDRALEDVQLAAAASTVAAV
jgi:hypothetical protein